MKRINITVEIGNEKVDYYFPKATIDFYKNCLENKTYVIIDEVNYGFIKRHTAIPFNKIVELSIEEI